MLNDELELNMIALYIVLFIIVFAGFFAGIFFFVLFIIKKFSGDDGSWQKLLLNYKYQSAFVPEGISVKFKSVKVGNIIYRNSMNLIITSSGLYLSTNFLFGRIPALYIPWNSISQIEDDILYWKKSYKLSIGNPIISKITLMKPEYDLIMKYMQIE
jgi:hypothetical protein